MARLTGEESSMTLNLVGPGRRSSEPFVLAPKSKEESENGTVVSGLISRAWISSNNFRDELVGFKEDCVAVPVSVKISVLGARLRMNSVIGARGSEGI